MTLIHGESVFARLVSIAAGGYVGYSLWQHDWKGVALAAIINLYAYAYAEEKG